MMKYENAYHYSFIEYLELLNNASFNARSAWEIAVSNNLSNLIRTKLLSTDLQISEFAKTVDFAEWKNNSLKMSPYSEELWRRLIAKFGEWIVLVTDTEDITDIAKTAPLGNIISCLDETYVKYASLLGYYTAQRDNLLKGSGRSYIRALVRNSTGSNTGANEQTVKIKDTPQTDISPSSDAYNSEVHWTHDNATQSATSSGEDYESYTENVESESVMNRLADIGNKMINIWDLWLKEFEKFFISPLNIER